MQPEAHVAADVWQGRGRRRARRRIVLYWAGDRGFAPQRMQKGAAMAEAVQIRNLHAVRMAALPHRGAYNKVGAAFQELSGLIEARALWPEVEGCAMVSYDNPRVTPEADLRSHAAFLVSEAFPIAAPIEELRYPAGRYAVLLHRGPYDGLPEAYRVLGEEWYPSSGESHIRRPPYELYLNDPNEVAAADLLTEIRLPLAAPDAE